jgi:hypothetical protein
MTWGGGSYANEEGASISARSPGCTGAELIELGEEVLDQVAYPERLICRFALGAITIA